MEAMLLEDFMNEHTKKNKQVYTANAHEKLVTVSEYSKMTGIPGYTIRYQLQTGDLEGKKFGRNWRVKVVDETASEKDAEIDRLKEENATLRAQIQCISILGKETSI